MPETLNGFEYEEVAEVEGYQLIDMTNVRKIIAYNVETEDVWTVHPYGESETDDKSDAIHTVKEAIKVVHRDNDTELL